MVDDELMIDDMMAFADEDDISQVSSHSQESWNPHSARNGRGQTIKKQAQGGDSSAGKQEKRNLKCEDEEPTN
jgi:hypothetical protein